MGQWVMGCHIRHLIIILTRVWGIWAHLSLTLGIIHSTKHIVRFFRNSVICQQRAAPCRRHRCIHLLRWVWPVSTNKTMALFPIDQRYGHLAGFAGVLLWCTYRPFPLSYTVMKTDFSFVTISIVAGSSFQSVFSNLLVIIWITYLIEFFK